MARLNKLIKKKRKKAATIGRKSLNLSEEEKKERHRLAAKRYRERLKEKAKSDPKAQKQVDKDKYNRLKGSAVSFIRNYIKKSDISYIREELAERQKELREKSKKN
ncbi:hypothetical protein FP435_04590 [Lactobacillus sp. PV037]|uniref:hypothetical protein n=1 Tax=Lactobacillus sp. PV037 TaxID=2594496 RepID=UPI002240CC9A|nr:hypothetical protein [Lactobacillus sp. PV037]QNQ83769.1 hypothetical protein FP435_04590 [Lactobacillus sp. PV037]